VSVVPAVGALWWECPVRCSVFNGRRKYAGPQLALILDSSYERLSRPSFLDAAPDAAGTASCGTAVAVQRCFFSLGGLAPVVILRWVLAACRAADSVQLGELTRTEVEFRLGSPSLESWSIESCYRFKPRC